jgi:NAD(P)-dependent dehydrogenase (short-subunit alcohol dehydrogenase family)
MKIENKVAVVTGGAQGLGEATVRMLLEKKAKVNFITLGCDCRYE